MKGFFKYFQWLVVFVVIIGSILGSARPAEAYALEGTYWSGSWPVVPYYINAASFPASVGTQQQIIDAIRKGANHWNFESSATITFLYMGTTTIAATANDGTNVVYYDPNNCSSPYSNCIALTSWWPATGALSGFDIRYNGKDTSGQAVTWDAVDPILFAYDLWGTSAHEFGHALGLAHSTVSTSTMAVAGMGATWQRFLISDDIQGAQYLYGVNSEITATNLNPVAGDVVTITMNFADSGGLLYQFLSTLNGSSPGTDLSQSDAMDYRILQLNQAWLDMTAYPTIFQNTIGYVGSRGAANMTYNTAGLSGICLDFAGAVINSGWPNGVRHITPAVHICVQ